MKKIKKSIGILLCLFFLFGTISPVFAADEASDKITRISCTVNGNASTERGFCWYTKEKSDSKIAIFKDGVDITDSLDITIKKTEKWKDEYVHKVNVGSLEPGTAYTYKVSSGGYFGKEGSFTTDGLDNDLDFIVVADVQAKKSEDFKKGADALAKAYDIMPNPDFICNLGDFTDDSNNEQWDYYFENFEQFNLNTTLVPVAGNHDGLLKWDWFNKMFNLDASESVQNLNGINYSFDYANAHFVILNTNDELCVSVTQLKWLESDLKSTDKDWKIVFMHKSPFTLGKDGRLPDAQYLQTALPPVFDRCGVDIVFSGHDHMYLRTKKLKNGEIDESGTTYVLSGTLGRKRYNIRTYLAGTYLNTDHIANLTIQHSDANYWNGFDWNSYNLNNIGSCFNCVSINDDKLTLNSYIYRDKFTESQIGLHDLTAEQIEELNDEDLVIIIDSLTITKRENTIDSNGSYEYDPSVISYVVNFIPSFLKLAKFAFATWLPNFIVDTLHGKTYY